MKRQWAQIGLLMLLAGIVSGCNTDSGPRQPDAAPMDEIIFVDNSHSMYESPNGGRDFYIKYLMQVIEAGCPKTHIIIYAFSGQKEVSTLEKIYEGTPAEPDEVAQSINQALPKVDPQNRNTYYSSPLQQILTRVRSSKTLVSGIILSDGGINPENVPPAQKVVSDLAQEPNFAGLLVLPVTDGKWRQLLETQVLKPLGNRGIVAGLEDAEEAQDRFFKLGAVTKLATRDRERR